MNLTGQSNQIALLSGGVPIRTPIFLIKHLLVPLFVIMLFRPSLGWAQDPVDYFKTTCQSCHTIGGGRLAGPDLKDVSERQERAWLVEFILDPASKLDSPDPYAKKIFDDAGGVFKMPKPANINNELAEKLLDLIDAESKTGRYCLGT